MMMMEGRERESWGFGVNVILLKGSSHGVREVRELPTPVELQRERERERGREGGKEKSLIYPLGVCVPALHKMDRVLGFDLVACKTIYHWPN